MTARRASAAPPETCAVCGAAIPPQAKACPECGADERTGWRDQDIYDGLELPDSAWEDADTDEGDRSGASGGTHRALRKGESARQRRGELPWYWLATAAFLALFLGLATLALLRG